LYAKSGIHGLKRKRSSGRPPSKKTTVKKIIPEPVKKDAKLFGFLKRRCVVRDIAKELEKESGIPISKSHVERIMDELGLSYMRPKLHVKSDAPPYYRRKREVRNYKKIASALQKKRILVGFQDETWGSLYPKIESEWMKRRTQKRVLTPKRNKRRNTFVILLWPERKNGLFFNIYPHRR
jgi:transposase